MSIYNEDELNAPSWLTADYVEHVLRLKHQNENIHVINMDVTPASLKGDHFASIMFRLKVTYTKDQGILEKSLIVKTLPESGGLKLDLLGQAQVFQTEIGMYKDTLPQLEDILSRNGDDTTFGPRIIYTSYLPHKVIIMEDLCVRGYHTIRDGSLKLAELKAVLKKLGKLHAVSFALGQSDQPEMVTKYQEGIFSNDKMIDNEMCLGGISKFINMLESDEDLQEYAPIFKSIEEEIIPRCKSLYRAHYTGTRNQIYVLNHGDFHMKNMMFKHNDKDELEDVLMLDFQFSVFAPCNIDLTSATYMLLSPKQRLEQCRELTRYYFECFLQTLKTIKFAGDIPRFSQFKMQELEFRHHALFLLTTFLPMAYVMLYTKPEDMKDIDTSRAFDSVDFLSSLYQNPAYKEELKQLLPILLNSGYID